MCVADVESSAEAGTGVVVEQHQGQVGAEGTLGIGAVVQAVGVATAESGTGDLLGFTRVGGAEISGEGAG